MGLASLPWKLLALIALSLCAGCAGERGAPAWVRRQGASDLGCPVEGLTYQRRANDAYRVYGCGKAVDYVRACPPSGCAWMRDSAPRRSDGPPPPPPPPPTVDLPPTVHEPPPPSAPAD